MYNTIDEVRRERHKLENRSKQQEKRIKSQYKNLRNNPFGDSKLYTVFRTAVNLGHLISFLRKFQGKKR